MSANSWEKEIEDLKQGYQQHDAILRGSPTSGRGGLVALSEALGKAVFGSETDPGSGLIAEVRALKKTVTLATGAIIGVEVLIKVIPEIVNLLSRKP